MRLYEILSDSAPPMYVFAGSNDEAALLYVIHREALYVSPPSFSIERIDHTRKWKRDAQLKAALRRDLSGLGTREEQNGHWTIKPHETPSGEL